MHLSLATGQCRLCYSPLNTTLQTNLFITSDGNSLCYSPPNTISHCRWTCFLLPKNVFYAGDEHFWCWRQMCFTLEMNTLVLEMSALKTCAWTSATHTHRHRHRHTQTHTYTQLATSTFQTKLTRVHVCRDDCWSQLLTSKNRHCHAAVIKNIYM